MFRYWVYFAVLISFVGATNDAGSHYEIRNDGSKIILKAVLTGSGQIVEVVPARAFETSDRAFSPLRDSGYVLWIDRNHRNAIAENLVISGDGHYIFANWWLNSQRVSTYDVLGTSTPLWEYPGIFVWNRGQSVGSSLSGNVLSATNQTTVFKWARDSANPAWSYNSPGFTGNSSIVSEDGLIVAAVAENGSDKRLYKFNAQTGETTCTASFSNSKPIQGLDISANGRIVVVTTYDTCFVFDNGVQRGGAILIGAPTCGTQYPGMISGDGSALITGDFYGRVRKYNWDGSNYVQRWMYQYPTGTYYNWISGKAISKDGSKIMIGVLDFGDGSNYTNSCAILLDSSSNVPRWLCHRYGDMVEATALSADGAYGIAGSWGMYGSTFGDVISVFKTSDSIPIFSVLDDIDEPGSIHTVDISNNGYYFAAGGKAVHAREMGNGGEVYAIRVMPAMIRESEEKSISFSSMIKISPNPFSNAVLIEFQMPEASSQRTEVRLQIYDVSGRVVRSFNLASSFSHLTSAVVWDGRDSGGNSLANGVYMIAVEMKGRVYTEKVCLIR